MAQTIQFSETNLADALKDPLSLQDTTERLPFNRSLPRLCVPVVTESTRHLFVDESFVPAKRVRLDSGHVVTTAPMKFGVKYDMLAVSMTEDTARDRLHSSIDGLMTCGAFMTIYMKIGDNVVAFSSARSSMPDMFTNVFSLESDTFDYVVVGLSAKTRQINGSLLTDPRLRSLVCDHHVHFIQLNVEVLLRRDLGEVVVNLTSVHLAEHNGQEVNQPLIDALGDGTETLGYDIALFRRG